MTTTTLRIAVLLVAIVVIFLLVKIYLHVLRSRVLPAIEPEASEDDAATGPEGATPNGDATADAAGEAEADGEEPPRG